MQWPIVQQGWNSDAARADNRPEGPHGWHLGDHQAVGIALGCAVLATLSLGVSVWIGPLHPDRPSIGAASWTLVVAGALLALLLVVGGLWLTASRAGPRRSVRSTHEAAGPAPDSDRLTGLLNRRAFMAFAADAMAYFQRYDRGFALLIVGIDDLAAADRGRGSLIDDRVMGHVADVLDLS